MKPVSVLRILSMPVGVLLLIGLLASRANSSATSTTWTAPPPDTARFAVIGDYGLSSQPELDVSNLVRSWNPGLIITTGDNNYPSGSASTIDPNIGQYYHDFIYPYLGNYGPGATSNQFFPVLGNHDWDTANAQPYKDYFALPNNERYYDYRWGPVHFFMVDSDPREPDGITSTSIQATWLQNQLATSTAPWKLVFFHHPPYSSGLHGSTTALQWPFQQWGASAVITGHDHDYERIIQNGFPYIVDGLGGNTIYNFVAPVPGSIVRYNGDYGAMLVDATAIQLTFQFQSRIGTIINTYTLNAPVITPTVSPTPGYSASATPFGVVETQTAIATASYTRSPTGTRPANTSTSTALSTTTATAPATSTPSETPIQSTFTPVQPVSTSTPTVCPIQFTDVDQNNAFYPYVRCLACAGIISGYQDGTFKPNNLVTRGQLAKIVSNAANFNEDPGTQIFEDVAPESTFYQWISRLTRRGYMSGYTCGSPGEPCVNGDRPYFRPGANATRGQTSKIVSNATRYNEDPTEQSFEDVPATHPFYQWIQRLASHGAMGGYNCGGPGEPCGSENRPYFRPYNNVTRGQSAKIVANTFYPDCQTP